MNIRADEVRRAYAVFGLLPGAPAGQVRRRYKALARQWHPDRHGSVPRNEAEAASRMSEINAAYRCLAAHLGRLAPRPAAEGAILEDRSGRSSEGRSLSRQELDRLVQSIGSDGPMDWLLDELGWVGSAFRGVLVGLFVVGCIARIALAASSEGSGALVRDPTLFLIVALLALLLLQERIERRKLLRQ